MASQRASLEMMLMLVLAGAANAWQPAVRPGPFCAPWPSATCIAARFVSGPSLQALVPGRCIARLGGSGLQCSGAGERGAGNNIRNAGPVRYTGPGYRVRALP
jgi:hypothetical protein